MYGHPKAKNVKDVEVEVNLPEEKPSIGKVCQIEIVVRPQEAGFMRYAFFELINERTDKRAPMDRVTSRSRYFYRYNVEQSMDADGENKYSFPMRIPVHKEPSRNDKFICIKWQLSLKAVFSKEEEGELLCAEATPLELDVI